MKPFNAYSVKLKLLKMLPCRSRIATTIKLLIIMASFSLTSAQTNKDEVTFGIALKNFQSAVLHKDLGKAANFMHFPLFTSKAEFYNGKELPADAIGRQEFELYENEIFNAEVSRILPKLGKEAIREIAGNEESYYLTLKNTTDSKSKMYECYVQYPTKNGIGENYFAFIFGKIKNDYKVIAYYSKWPVR